MRSALLFALVWVPLAPALAVEYDFVALPAEPAGVEYWKPVAVADSGAVLFQELFLPQRAFVYHNGRYQTIDFPPHSPGEPRYWAVTDINTPGEILVNHEDWLYGLLLVSRPYVRDRHGSMETDAAPDPRIHGSGLNNQGVAVGTRIVPCPVALCGECVFEWCIPPTIRTAVIVHDGVVVPLPIPREGNVDKTSGIAIDDAGRILGFRENAWDSGGTYFLLDGDRLSWLEPPAGLDPYWMEFTDMNNRGQLVGNARNASFHLRGFVREPDGTDFVIHWDYPWPESIVTRAGAEEDYVAHRLGVPQTTILGINDRGQLLVSGAEGYLGYLPDGSTRSFGRWVTGVGTRRGARQAVD